jgi:hypothetical protein
MHYRLTATLILLIGCLSFSLPQTNHAQQEEDQINVPRDLTLILELLSPISTATNQKGDSFSCKVLSPGEYAGATISGHIGKLKRSGKANKKSEMYLDFDAITMIDGRTGGFNAQVVEVYEVAGAGNNGQADTEGTVKGKSRVKVSVKRAVAGAIIGGILGGIIGGAQGAAAGATIGASIGVTSVLAIDGPDLEFKEGTQFKILTNAPAHREKASLTPPRMETPKAPVTETKTQIQQQVAISPIPVPRTISPAPEPSRPAPPHVPSSRLRNYTGGNLFNLSIPANWHESSSNNPVTFAPEGGYIFYHGQLVLTHGLRIGVQPAQNHNLQQASDLYVNVLLQANTYLQKQDAPRNSSVAEHAALIMTFAGESPVTGSAEVVTVYTTMLRSGDLFYIIAVVSKDQYREYEGPFLNSIRSIQIKD